MSALKAFIAKLRLGATASAPIIPAVCTSLPTFTGGAYTGNTVAAVHGVWDHPVFQYESGWFITPFPFGNLTQIAGQSGMSYTYQAGDVGNKVCYGERVLTTSGWSQWAYSVLSGIVSATPVMTPPTITAGATATPSSGLKVGDVIQINAPTISNASDWWISIERDGVGSEPIADVSDTYPFSYAIQPGDVSTSFKIVTWASNGAGTVNNSTTTPNIGPIQLNGSLVIQDLGSAQATEDYLSLGYNAGLWVFSGAATKTATINSPDALKTWWTANVVPASLAERIDITLDWDGMAQYQGGETTALFLPMPYAAIIGNFGNSGFADNGGWVRLKAAPGKRPGFANQVSATGCRGFITDGIDFLGKGTSHGEGCLKISRPGDPIFHAYNCRFGRTCVDPTVTFATYITGLYMFDTADQVHIENCTFAGNNIGFKTPSRKVKIVNCDFSKNYTDLIRCYTHDRTGYYAYLWIERSTVRMMLEIPEVSGLHADFVQNGNHPSPGQAGDSAIEGHRVIILDAIVHMTHKYGTQGTQGIQNGGGNPTVPLDNTFCVRRSIILNSSPASFRSISPGCRITSYIERTTMGRAGVVSSTFDTDTINSDNTPGVATGPTPQRSGIAFVFDSCIIGTKPGTNPTWMTFPNTVVINYKTNKAGIIPENVFNGRDFERGGPSSDYTPNKFGYIMPNEGTQAGFVSDIIANFTPLPAYAGKGAPAPNPANYSAPALG